jgi:hypothetical protein
VIVCGVAREAVFAVIREGASELSPGLGTALVTCASCLNPLRTRFLICEVATCRVILKIIVSSNS